MAKSIREELKNLYLALGGTNKDLENYRNLSIEGLIHAIYILVKNGGGGTQELPIVGPGDNGKVLMVVNGKWGKADLPTIPDGTNIEY